MADQEKDFAGTKRFVVERRLGSGAFGTVYQAYDKQRQAQVALKRLHRADPVGLLGLKREFRSLADLFHPNLVSLYELLSDEDGSFISMELVVGTEFDNYVHSSARVIVAADSHETRPFDERETGAEVVIAPRPLEC